MAEFNTIKDRAIEIRNKYKQLEIKVMGKPWTYYERSQGMMVDMGEFMEFTMAKAGVRRNKWGDDLDHNIEHELSDILWDVLIIADELGIDIENKFMETMNNLDTKIENDIKKVA